MAKKFTNLITDGEVSSSNPDAQRDFYKISDKTRDINYFYEQFVDTIKEMSISPSVDCQILYGGVVSDGGAGTIDISAGVALGKDADGNVRVVRLPAYSGVAMPSGWNDDRQIWVASKYDYKKTADVRNHAITGESYHYILEDAETNDANAENRPTNGFLYDADPGTTDFVIWGSFKMNVAVFEDLSKEERGEEFMPLYLQKDNVNSRKNNFVLEAITNNTFTPASGSNPHGLFFDDLKPRYGLESSIWVDVKAIGESDSSGKIGYYPVDARTGVIDKRFRLYGAWARVTDSLTGDFYIQSTQSGDYIEITDIMDNLILLHYGTATAGVLSIYKNGVDTVNNLDPSQSAVVTSKGFRQNHKHEVDANFAGQAICHITLEKDDTNETSIYGVNIVNEATASSQEITVPSGVKNIQGKEVSVAAKTGSDSLNVKDGIVGTKGGFVGHYVDVNGDWQSEKQEPENYTETGVAEYNAAASDSVSGLTDSSKFYDNSQGNITRTKITADTDKALLVVPSGAPDANNLTLANDYDGVADTTLFAGNKQFEPDGATGVVIADQSAVTVELYGKIGANVDHSNEEPTKRRIGWDSKLNKIVARDRLFNVLDFGNQLSDDFTSLPSTGSNDAAYTKDDGSSNLVCNDCQYINGGLRFNANGAFLVYTFYGIGIDIERFDSAAGGADQVDYYIDGVKVFEETVGDTETRITEVASDLPVGFHTLKIYQTAGATFNIAISNFITYLPKQPVLTENFHYDIPNYVLADFVSTNLPTLELTAYNGAIDQGVIRKSNVREFVYTGTWTYTVVDIAGVSGRGINSAVDADDASLQAYFSGHFRTWNYFTNAGDDEYVNVDGANQQINNPGVSTRFYGFVYDTVSPAEGLHTINRIVHRTAGNVYFDSIDYHCPIWNPDQWRTNPYRGYLIDGQGVCDNRKFSAYDEKLSQRKEQVLSNVASGTIFSSTTLFASIASDIPNAVIGAEMTARCDTGAAPRTMTPAIFENGVQIVQDRQKFNQVDAMLTGRPHIDRPITRRKGFFFQHGTDTSLSLRSGAEWVPVRLYVINIGEDD